MTKIDLIDELASRQRVTRQIATTVVETVFSEMRRALESGSRVEIRGFGVFTTRAYDGYTGSDPRSGQTIRVGPKTLPRFKMAKALKDLVNQEDS